MTKKILKVLALTLVLVSVVLAGHGLEAAGYKFQMPSGFANLVGGIPYMADRQNMVCCATKIEISQSYTGTGNRQTFAGDLTLTGTGVGHTGGYLAGVMGNLQGASTVTAAGSNAANSGGVVGKYSLAGTAYTPGYKRGGVIGEASGTADCAVCGIVSDSTNSAVITIDSIFGVDHQMGFSASKVNWGLNLQAASHDVYTPKAYTKGAVLLDNDICILTGTAAPSNGVSGTGAGNCGPGSIHLNTSDGKTRTNTNTKASPTWTVAGSQS